LLCFDHARRGGETLESLQNKARMVAQHTPKRSEKPNKIDEKTHINLKQISPAPQRDISPSPPIRHYPSPCIYLVRQSGVIHPSHDAAASPEKS
jgi:hypothetical protein